MSHNSDPIRLVNIIFIVIGLLIGVILVLQIQANPVRRGSSPVDEFEVKRQLLTTFSLEQEELKKKLSQIQKERDDAQKILDARSSKAVRDLRMGLLVAAGQNEVKGAGIEITMADNPRTDRFKFSTSSENFVQASDIRDLVNALFLQEAQAISINGVRVNPLTAIHSAFDTILVGNLQLSSPFVIKAVGNAESLRFGIKQIPRSGISIFVDNKGALTIPASDNLRTFQFAQLTKK